MLNPNSSPASIALAQVFDGWNGYQTSLINAVQPLTSDQLAWRPTPQHRSVGEFVRHMSLGRVSWWSRMPAPGSAALADQIPAWATDSDGNRDVIEDAIAITDDASSLVQWLERTWQMIDTTLHQWTVADLVATYEHRWNDQVYAVSRQWTVWRIMAHDIHHGGELSLMLGMQGIAAFELSELGGHIVLPPLASDD